MSQSYQPYTFLQRIPHVLEILRIYGALTYEKLLHRAWEPHVIHL